MKSSGCQNYPKSESEPMMILDVNLAGRNEAQGVEVNSWTNDMPINFLGLQPTAPYLQYIESQYLDSNVPVPDPKFAKIVNDLKRIQFITLEELAKSAFQAFQMIPRPVEVFVIAKKKIDFIVRDDYVFLFGEMLVADSTGCALVKVVNDAIALFYDKVSIGDRLIISSGNYVQGTQHDLDFCLPAFNPDIFHNVAIKLSFYQCRRAYKIVQNPRTYEVPQRFLEGRFRGLKTPSIIEQNEEFWLKFGSNPGEEEFIDIIGIISYVSRVERVQRYSKPCYQKNALSPVGKYQSKDLPQYNLYQWIEIVDKDCEKPIPAVGKLVPGNLVILSHVEVPQCLFGYERLATSRISCFYTDSGIQEYLELMPKSPEYSNLMGIMMNPRGALYALTRANVIWSAGGYFPEPIRSEADFTKFYNTNHKQNKYLAEPRIPLQRRETQFLMFRGMILSHKLVHVDKKGIPKWSYRNSEICKRFPVKPEDWAQALARNFSAENPKDSWFSFQWGLPKLDYSQVVEPDSAIDYYEFTSAAHSKYCRSLGAPSDGSDYLKTLTLANGPEYYILEILNLDIQADLQPTLGRYSAIWSPSRLLPLETMKSKLELSKGKNILIQMNIHRVEFENLESAQGYEFCVQDFTTDEYFL